jgi:flagellar hook-associated protein 1 FlgK
VTDAGFAIAASGLEADNAAMDAIANNLSNVNTPGYASESATLVNSPSFDQLGIGSGVTVLDIGQASDAMLNADSLSASASSASTSALQEVLGTVQSIFPEPGSNGLSAQLSTFWSSWDAISTDPSQTAPRTEVIDQAQNIASTLNQETAQLSQTAANAGTQASATVTEVNTLASQVAALNQSIVASTASGAQPNSLIDQRNNLVDQLSQDIGVTTQAQANGSLNVYVGGVCLVQGNTADSFKIAGSGTGTISVVSNNTGVTVPVASGTMAGLLQALNVSIPSAQSQLDGVATALASTVNGQLGQGYDAAGNTDVPVGTGVGPNNSAPLFVIGSGSGAQSQAQQSLSQSLNESLQSVVGVNSDQQTVDMLGFQQAYQASAKVISTIDTMVQSLLAAT